jgi:hypothetical protein
MRLQDLRQRLYSKQSDIESRKPQTDVYDPRSKEAESLPAVASETVEAKDWKIETGTTQKQKTLLILVAAVIAGVIVLGGGGYIVYRIFKKDFKQQQVQLKIEVPPAVNLNEEVAISIPFANNNPVDLKDAHLVVNVPPNFEIASTNPQADSTGTATAEWSLGNVAPQQSKSLELRGRFTGRDEDSASFKAIVTYTPSNFSSKFQNDFTASTKVIGVPLSMFVEATRTAASGYAITYQVKLRNIGGDPFQDLKVNLTYPQGYTLVHSSEPLAGDNQNSWNIPTILGNEEKVLTLDGKIEGVVGDQKILSVSIGKDDPNGFVEYSKKESSTEITDPPIVISQAVDNDQTVVHKGDPLNFSINYTNKADRSISQAVVKLKLDGTIFDLKSIEVEDGGWYDSNNKEIVWQAGKVPALAMINPGDTGKLSFRIKISDFIPFTNDKKSNFTGQTAVSIESSEMPTPIGADKVVTGNTLQFKLSSTAGLSSTVFYSDGTIPNSGPIPPTVGKKTTYTVHWTLTNAFNDLRGVEVKTVLPYGVDWEDRVFPSKTGVEFNKQTREITWNLERIPAGAGIDKPSSSLIFQISLTPTDDQAGKSPDLIGDVSFKGTDVFTQETVGLTARAVNSTLPDDKSMNEDMGRVIRPGDETFSQYSSNDTNNNTNGD